MNTGIKITLGDDSVHEFDKADLFALHPLGFLIIHSRGKAHFFNTETVAYYSYDIEENKELEGADMTNVVRLQ